MSNINNSIQSIIAKYKTMKKETEKSKQDTFDVEDRSTWATVGGVILGVGVGFFFLHTSVLYFVGCILCGLGLGLMVTVILSRNQKDGNK
jgi:F0F1-type ATP synthase assembly protein I